MRYFFLGLVFCCSSYAMDNKPDLPVEGKSRHRHVRRGSHPITFELLPTYAEHMQQGTDAVVLHPLTPNPALESIKEESEEIGSLMTAEVWSIQDCVELVLEGVPDKKMTPLIDALKDMLGQKIYPAIIEAKMIETIGLDILNATEKSVGELALDLFNKLTY